MNIAIIGTGYVGLVSGVCLSGFGHTVICVDKSAAKIDQLNAGEVPICEPGLDVLLAKNSVAGRLAFTTQVCRPSPRRGIRQAPRDHRLRYQARPYPGATEEDCVPVLERVSGLKYNEDFFCGYSPERINPGDKAHRLTAIRKVASGSTSRSSCRLPIKVFCPSPMPE